MTRLACEPLLKKAREVKKLIGILFVLALASVAVFAQEKGVDKQNEGIRDAGNSRAPASNGSKQDNGAGRGMDFGKGRSPAPPPVANPYRLAIKRDAILKAVEELMRDRKLVIDSAASRPDDGMLISQPYTFAKGAVVAQSELSHYAELSEATSRGWTRGRYTTIVEVQPIDGNNANVSVNVKIEGRTDGASGPEWVTLRSSGVAEEEFLIALIEKLTGAPPPGRSPSP
ncbi:MAG: hypothetical protein QOJ64_2411 [Acidobacteriota bacterium]|jgi:hypothetical protein|nr:hypothetical protein [Acidobacteriota bacterium]